jgi:hypothetical protein
VTPRVQASRPSVTQTITASAMTARSRMATARRRVAG